MKNNLYLIKLASGEIVSGRFENILAVAQRHPDADEIKELYKSDLRARLASLNHDLSSVSYLALIEIDDFFRQVLTGHKFGFPADDIFQVGRSQDGRIGSIDIGGAYLTVTWHKMGSGKFEIVSYAN